MNELELVYGFGDLVLLESFKGYVLGPLSPPSPPLTRINNQFDMRLSLAIIIT